VKTYVLILDKKVRNSSSAKEQFRLVWLKRISFTLSKVTLITSAISRQFGAMNKVQPFCSRAQPAEHTKCTACFFSVASSSLYPVLITHQNTTVPRDTKVVVKCFETICVFPWLQIIRAWWPQLATAASCSG